MKLITSVQKAEVRGAVGAKFAMIAPVLEAMLHSLPLDRTARLGGAEKVTLHDLARELRSGSGDAGICFEYAVHEAIATRSPLIHELASDVLGRFCNIKAEAASILFGPEKDGRIPILESVQDALTEDSIVFVGNRGRPPKLRRYIPQIVNAFRRAEERNRLPRSISGLWKADLFLGSAEQDIWVGTTVKIKGNALDGAKGLRVGIYPQENAKDRPRLDSGLNLVRLPLPYDGAFMELFYKAFFLTRAFMRADASVPREVDLPDAEDRMITKELASRRQFPVLEVIEAMGIMAQEDLLETSGVLSVKPSATLSAEAGLQSQAELDLSADSVSLTPSSNIAKA